jgi:hypothetical protein
MEAKNPTQKTREIENVEARIRILKNQLGVLESTLRVLKRDS